MVLEKHYTAEEFDAFAELPENADRLLEYIGGEIVEVPPNAYASETGGILFGELYIFLKGKDWGHLTGEAGGYIVSGEPVEILDMDGILDGGDVLPGFKLAVKDLFRN